MAILKCKMCGGDIEISADKTFGTCGYCGSSMTFPKVDDDQRVAAFNRGNHFRRIGEFDKALTVYERIVSENDTDAEAHWCCALCRFGIEYVEDPATYEYLPTCHRASFDSFLNDVDYLAAVAHSDGVTKRQYQKDAAKIAEVQRGILATSQNTEPYDVFICYKESDENGNRTKDSLLAQDIYYQLAEQNRKVFFARITLEDVAGAQYEPYIFAALNSAKVMIVVGTKPEYLNAVWVKNEWSRFLAMMKKDRHKLLLPCYRDMDPYDMPEALSVLQSYDMGKIGFLQDLTRGIAKVLDADKKPTPVKETVMVQQSGGVNIAPLLKRAFMFLEDGDWGSANEYCEKVLDQDPECAEAYLGKLMAELRVKKQDGLKDCAAVFDSNSNYQKTMRFANKELKSTLVGYIEHIVNRNKTAHLQDIYQRAINLTSTRKTENAYKEAQKLFVSISHYKDAAVLAAQCAEKAEIARKDEIYNRANNLMQSGEQSKLEQAILLFGSISGWQDADDLAQRCAEQVEKLKQAQAERQRKEKLEREKIAREKAEAERRAKEKAEADRIEAERIAKKKKKITMIATIIICVIIAVSVVFVTVIIPSQKYEAAVALMNADVYTEAITAFEDLGGFKDSKAQIEKCYDAIYQEAVALKEKGGINEAIRMFHFLDGFKDSRELLTECEEILEQERIAAENESLYLTAIEAMQNGEFDTANKMFTELGNYKDSSEQALEAIYQKALKLLQFEGITDLQEYYDTCEKAYSLFESLGAYNNLDQWLTNNTAYVRIKGELTWQKGMPTSANETGYFTYDEYGNCTYEPSGYGGRMLLKDTTLSSRFVSNVKYDEAGNVLSFKWDSSGDGHTVKYTYGHIFIINEQS